MFRRIIISNKWEKILNEVHNASKNSNMGIRLGSALLHRGKIIKTGYNRNDRSQWHGITMPGVHAEMSVTHSISPHNRPKTYRRLWSNGDSKNRSYDNGPKFKNWGEGGQRGKGAFEEL